MQKNLAILICLMGMTNAILENKSLHCEKYVRRYIFYQFHSFLYSFSFINYFQLLCHVFYHSNFAFDQMLRIIGHYVILLHYVVLKWPSKQKFNIKYYFLFNRIFSSNVHGLRNRIVRIFLRTFHNESSPLVTHYGALIGLCEMGQEVKLLM